MHNQWKSAFFTWFSWNNVILVAGLISWLWRYFVIVCGQFIKHFFKKIIQKYWKFQILENFDWNKSKILRFLRKFRKFRKNREIFSSFFFWSSDLFSLYILILRIKVRYLFFMDRLYLYSHPPSCAVVGEQKNWP